MVIGDMLAFLASSALLIIRDSLIFLNEFLLFSRFRKMLWIYVGIEIEGFSISWHANIMQNQKVAIRRLVLYLLSDSYS